MEAGEADQEQWDREYHATLGQLRRELGRTQTEMAAAVATHQPQISEIERRDDILVSTARSFVAALGADLELVARLPDGRKVIIDLGEIGRASRGAERRPTTFVTEQPVINNNHAGAHERCPPMATLPAVGAPQLRSG